MTAYASEPGNGFERLRHPLPSSCAYPIRMSIHQLAAEVGLTSRTIRSYQTRGLIQPPHRIGRTPYYGPEHLTRLRLVIQLQHRGLSLDGIRALLEPDLVIGQLLVPGREIASVLRADYELAEALLACGVLIRLPDGGLGVRNARAVLACGAGNSSEMATKAALWALVDAIGELLPSAEAMLEQLRVIVCGRLPDSTARQTSELAVEVFRLCLNLARPLSSSSTRPTEDHRTAAAE
jgi:MerR HTH family regulatory protein